MSRYEIIDVPEFTEAQQKRVDELQAVADGATTLEDRQELLQLQWLEAANQHKISDPDKAVACYERYLRLR